MGSGVSPLLGFSALGGAGRATKECLNSFAPSTEVEMADGSRKPIEDVEVGDKVLATDPETGETQAREVTALHRNKDTDMAEVTVRTIDGHTATIHTTQHHPFWNATRKTWVDATDLRQGDTLTSPNGRPAHVINVRRFINPRHMYNLTVDDLHTYYVLAGSTPILVHNSSCPRFIADASGNIIELPQVNSSISRQKQDRHILGGNGYKGGGYFSSQTDAQAVLDAYNAGQAEIMGITKNGHIQIRVTSVTGYDNNPARQRFGVPTHIFMIKGTKSPSVVPMNPFAGAP
jgi:hypothetical protein